MIALVEATEISGPATVSTVASLSRAMLLSGTFTMDRIFWPRSRSIFIAARLSAVSPLWLIRMAAPPSGSGGSR